MISKRSLYIRNLKYAYLPPIFRLQNIPLYSLPAHTNTNGYCVSKNRLKREFSRFLMYKNKLESFRSIDVGVKDRNSNGLLSYHAYL